jgi:hypothetical protein
MRYSTHFADTDIYDPDRLALTKPCDHAGCAGVGAYRAPKGRDRLQDYYWFCLAHVRDYNAKWNYYAGMNEAMIEAHLRDDAGWQRETWPLGTARNRGKKLDEQALRDHVARTYTMRHDDAQAAHHHTAPAGNTAAMRMLPPDIITALTTLELAEFGDAAHMKAQYRIMVKRHHPDANGGSSAAEERLKRINQAYTLLREWLS